MPTTTRFSVDLTEEQLFELLGHEVRMEVLRVLWETFEFDAYVTQSRDPVPFTDLRERAAYDGSGNFGYHLEKLVGTLVEKTAEGYLLSPLGYNIMRALDTYATFEYETLDETVLADSCPFCGGNLLGSYQRQVLAVSCQSCDGLAETGYFTFVQLESTTVAEVDIPDLLDAGIQNLEQRVRSSLYGRCWECHSTLDRTLEYCDAHASTDRKVCAECDHRYAMLLDVECPNCGTGGRGPLFEYAMLVPEVRVLLANHGLGARQVGPWRYRLAAFEAVEETDLTTDPPGVTYRFERGDDAVAVRIEDRDGITSTVL